MRQRRRGGGAAASDRRKRQGWAHGQCARPRFCDRKPEARVIYSVQYPPSSVPLCCVSELTPQRGMDMVVNAHIQGSVSCHFKETDSNVSVLRNPPIFLPGSSVSGV